MQSYISSSDQRFLSMPSSYFLSRVIRLPFTARIERVLLYYGLCEQKECLAASFISS